MAAFLPPPKSWAIFGDNLFEIEGLLPIFRALLGISEGVVDGGEEGGKGFKPLDCVGTVEEARGAFYLAMERYKGFFGYDFIEERISSPSPLQHNSSLVFFNGPRPLPRLIPILISELRRQHIVEGKEEKEVTESISLILNDFNPNHLIPDWFFDRTPK